MLSAAAFIGVYRRAIMVCFGITIIITLCQHTTTSEVRVYKHSKRYYALLGHGQAVTDYNKNLAIANRSRVSCINTNNNIMTLKSGLEVTQCH